MAKYRKKPLVIEAMQLTRMFADVAIEWLGEDNILYFNTGEFKEDECYIEIKVPKGFMTASEGDYIIKGIDGEFYACKADVFEASYDEVTE